jgi:DNA replication protein DnaC
MNREPVDSALVYERCSEIVWDSVPVEYRGATLPQPLVDLLNKKTVNILLYGPPGTGKTRLCWAIAVNGAVRKLKNIKSTEHHREVICSAATEYKNSLETFNSVVDRVSDECLSYISAEIISESADILRHRYDREWLEKQAKIKIPLIVDDIGFMKAPSEWSQEAIYCLANERRANGRMTIWTTNLKPDEIRAAYGPAIASRLLGGQVIDVGGIDRRVS